MYVIEDTFGHLRQAAEERQRRELEYLRIAEERDAENPRATRRGLRNLIHGFRRSEYPAPQRFSHP